MAERIPLYLDFAEGEVKEFDTGDAISSTVISGVIPAGGSANQVLRKVAADDYNVEWATIAGTGDVVGPASSVDNRVVFFNGITGKLIKDSGLLLSGSNTGDQTSIVGITGTKAQFDTAVTDGNILYVGDITQYTDEGAQDAVGAMVDGTLVYVDATPLLTRAALTGDVTAAQASNTTVIANDAVTNAKLANMAASTIKGNDAGLGDPLDLSVTQVTAMLNVFTDLLKGLVPASGGGTANFLRADGTFAAPTATAPDIALSLLAPAVDETITAGYSAVVCRKYNVASAKKLSILSGAIFRIL